MLINRHDMSQTVRNEVTPKSNEWGYQLGSTYIRKVHFRDLEMIRQIESKVVNRLRQVTAAIKQDGANQVSIITSTAERQAAIEFAKAAALRPEIVGSALEAIAQDPAFETLPYCDDSFTVIPRNCDTAVVYWNLTSERQPIHSKVRLCLQEKEQEADDAIVVAIDLSKEHGEEARTKKRKNSALTYEQEEKVKQQPSRTPRSCDTDMIY
jgi:hypothetical protein